MNNGVEHLVGDKKNNKWKLHTDKITKVIYKAAVTMFAMALFLMTSVLLTGCDREGYTRDVAKQIKNVRDNLDDSSGADDKITNDIVSQMEEEDNTPGIKNVNADQSSSNIAGDNDGSGNDSISDTKGTFEINAADEDGNVKIGNRNDIKVYSSDGNLIEPEISVIEVDSSNVDKNKGSNGLVYASDLPEGECYHNKCYCYDVLGGSERQAYYEVYKVLESMTDDVILTTKDTDEVDLAFRAVMVDHPEMFYIKGYTVGKYMIGDKIDKIAFSGTYTLGKNEVLTKRKLVDNYVTNVIDRVPDGDDYEVIKFVYEYLINNNDYDRNAPDNQNILSVVEGGRTVCQGYAKMTQLILNRLGIFCTLVNGDAKGSVASAMFDTDEDGYQAHVWNIVKCDGQYYNLDTTWGDSAFTLVDNDTGQTPTIEVNYEYCLVPDEMLYDTHKPRPVVTMPRCSSMDDNYYVREGLYFTELSDNRVQAAFDKAYANGEDIVCFKCSDEYVYDDLAAHLIDDQVIFDFIKGNTIKYVGNPERNLLIFSI